MQFDAIIVGGGIIGCACAFFLSRAGMAVALVERDTIAGLTTANSFAWANASSKTSDRAYHALNAAGVAGYRALMREFGAQALGIRETGALFLARESDADAMRDLRDQQRALDGFGYAAELLGPSQLRLAEPGLRLPDDACALLTPDDLCVNAPHFARFLLARAVAAGAKAVEHCGPVDLIADDEGVVGGVRTGAGAFHAPSVIVAAGPDTPETLGELTGYDGFATRFPMRRAPGLLLTTPPLPEAARPRHVVGTPPVREVHFLPEFNGGLKIGSDDVDGMVLGDHSPHTMRRAGQELLDRAGAHVPALAGVRVEDCGLGIGVRPYPEDGKAIFGAFPGATGLFIVATHSGVTLAPVIGRHMATLVGGGRPETDIAAFSLDRFAGF